MPTRHRNGSYGTDRLCRMISRMDSKRLIALLSAMVVVLALSTGASADQPTGVLPARCVTISTPKPNREYTYRQTESGGNSSAFTDHWEEFTATGSRVLTKKTGGPGQGTITTVNRHRIMKGLYLLDSSSQTGTSGGARIDNSSSYVPAIVADAANPVCEKRSWPIRSSKVTNTSAHGTFSAMSDAGSLQITSIHESITVPAGKFDTVHSKRVMNTARGPAVDEYWKSIEHGVTVKRVHTFPGGGVTATLQAIK